jgi:beta-glucosidase/6-phospho-beta-glucosidase/beta-galactosidase
MAWIHNGSARTFPKGFFWGTLTAGTADIAEDVRAMKDLGATAYRFAIAWPRIFPAGSGEPNLQALDLYSRLVD